MAKNEQVEADFVKAKADYFAASLALRIISDIRDKENVSEENEKAIAHANACIFAEVNEKEIQLKVIIEDGTVTTVLSNIPYEKANVILVNLDRDYNFVKPQNILHIYLTDDLFKHEIH